MALNRPILAGDTRQGNAMLTCIKAIKVYLNRILTNLLVTHECLHETVLKKASSLFFSNCHYNFLGRVILWLARHPRRTWLVLCRRCNLCLSMQSKLSPLTRQIRADLPSMRSSAVFEYIEALPRS